MPDLVPYVAALKLAIETSEIERTPESRDALADASLNTFAAISLDRLGTTLAHQDFADAASIASRLQAATTPDSDEVAGRITDGAKICKVASETADSSLKSVTAALREVDQAARNLVNPVLEVMNGAVAAGKERLREWSKIKERAAAAELAERQRIAREEADRVAREERERQERILAEEDRVRRETEAAQRIAAEGVLPVPAVKPAEVQAEVRPAEVPLPVPSLAKPTQTRGSGSLSSVRRNPASLALMPVVEGQEHPLVLVARAHPEWLTLDAKAARAGFADEVKRQAMRITYDSGTTPDPNGGEPAAIESFAKMGLRVWFETSVAIK